VEARSATGSESGIACHYGKKLEQSYFCVG
jgi:hypothetical protein